MTEDEVVTTCVNYGFKNKKIVRKIEFKTAKEMVNWLMDNQGTELADGYGRRWKYENFNFYFKDIGTNDKYKEGISCLHLYGTPIGILGA